MQIDIVEEDPVMIRETRLRIQLQTSFFFSIRDPKHVKFIAKLKPVRISLECQRALLRGKNQLKSHPSNIQIGFRVVRRMSIGCTQHLPQYEFCVRKPVIFRFSILLGGEIPVCNTGVYPTPSVFEYIVHRFLILCCY